MINLWKWNLGIFGFQLLAGFVTYILTDHPLVTLVVCAVIVTLQPLWPGTKLLSSGFIMASAMFAPMTLVGTIVMMNSVLFLFLLLTLACAAMAACEARNEEGSKEHWVLLFITALPAGIGVLLGGTIIAFRAIQHAWAR